MSEEIKLKPDERVRLEALSTDIDKAATVLTKLEAAGVDVTELKDKLSKGIKLREGLLREF